MILILCTLAGLALGVMFYGGLWMTVRRLLTTPHPVLLTLGSLIVRAGLTLAGFVLVTNGRWQNTVACLVGFAAARMVVSRFLPVCT